MGPVGERHLPDRGEIRRLLLCHRLSYSGKPGGFRGKRQRHLPCRLEHHASQAAECPLRLPGKITRYISLDRWKRRSASKRGGGQTTLALDELEECVSGGENPEERLARKELLALVNRFLGDLPETERRVFVCRYWYLDSISEIAQRFDFTESKVKTMLHRTRQKLSHQLEKEGMR